MVSYYFIRLVRAGDGHSNSDGCPNLKAVSWSPSSHATTEMRSFIAGGSEVIRMRMAAIDAPEVWN